MSDTPTFTNPPVVEFVLGVQFAPLTKLTAGHFGLLWKMLGADWTRPEDAPPITNQFEQFDGAKWNRRSGVEFRLEQIAPLGRFVLNHRHEDRLLQVQSTRFHLNWRKTGELKPSYKSLISEFEDMFDRFRAFTVDNDLGELELNQWEVTYVDSFPQGEYWQSPADWGSLLPGLFGNLYAIPGLTLEQRAAQWSFEIEPKRGRLHIAAKPGNWRDDPRSSLLIDMTARGPIGNEVKTLREGLDLGHQVAVESFLEMISKETRQRLEEMR